MLLHYTTSGLELWIPQVMLTEKLRDAVTPHLRSALRRCADSFGTLLAVDDRDELLSLGWDCVASDSSHDSYVRLRTALLAAFGTRMSLLRKQGLFAPRINDDGLPSCTAVRGPFIDVTDPALVSNGLALPRVTLHSRCQTVAVTFARVRSQFDRSYSAMVTEPHTPAMVVTLWLNVRDETRLEDHASKLESVMHALCENLSLTPRRQAQIAEESF